MTENEILDFFNRTLRDLLNDKSISLTMNTKRDQVRGWDSFNYINFIVAIEVELGVKFKIADVESFPDVGAIVQATKSKLK